MADQASSVLRQAIAHGILSDPLPGEHQLARQLGISRTSLRAAMAKLRLEGLVVSSNGRRARLNVSRRTSAAAAPPVVCVVCPVARDVLLYNQHPIVLEMHANCASKGIGWEEAFDARLDGPHPDRRLRQLVSGRRHVCWILLACKGPMQRWFSRAKVPAFVLGSCLPGVELPSIDVDYRAVGWHAAGAIIKHGHRHIGLLRPRRPLAGDLAAHEGFLSYIANRPADISVTTVLIDSHPAALNRKLDWLVKSRHRPTAIFSNRLSYSVAAMFHLLRAGVRIPEDISLVMGDSHSVIDTTLPEMTRYRDINVIHAHRAVRIAEALLAGRHVPLKPSLFIPTFIPGSTLGPKPGTPG